MLSIIVLIIVPLFHKCKHQVVKFKQQTARTEMPNEHQTETVIYQQPKLPNQRLRLKLMLIEQSAIMLLVSQKTLIVFIIL